LFFWADKGKPGDIERALTDVLKTGVPQIARKLHEELEKSAASFFGHFLKTIGRHCRKLENWTLLWPSVLLDVVQQFR